MRTVAYGGEADQVLDVWDGDPQRSLVVVVHGGFWRPVWDRSHAVPLATAIAETGYPTVLVEYRRIPGDPDASCGDVREALSVLPGLVEHNGSVLLLGHSAGGHLVLWVAATCPPAGLIRTVGLAAVADLAVAEQLDLGSGAVAAFLGTRAADRPDLDPALLTDGRGELVLLTGDLDSTVPAEVAAAYTTRHPEALRQVVPGADHMDLIDPGHPAWETVRAALDT